MFFFRRKFSPRYDSENHVRKIVARFAFNVLAGVLRVRAGGQLVSTVVLRNIMAAKLQATLQKNQLLLVVHRLFRYENVNGFFFFFSRSTISIKKN